MKKEEKTMSKYVTIPEGAYLFRNWKVGGFMELKVKGQTYRHYCLSKVRLRKSGLLEEVRGYSAMTQKMEKGWRGILISDTSYYAKGMTTQKLVALMQGKSRKKRRK